MRKFQCLLFVLKRSYICYYITCMTVPLKLFILTFGIGLTNLITFFSSLSSLNFCYSPKTKQFALNATNSFFSFFPETVFLVTVTEMSNGFAFSIMWLIIFFYCSSFIICSSFRKIMMERILISFFSFT